VGGAPGSRTAANRRPSSRRWPPPAVVPIGAGRPRGRLVGARYASAVGDGCEVVLRRDGARAHYHAQTGASAVARSRSFDPDDLAAVAGARRQIDAVLRALGWAPTGSDRRWYRRAHDHAGVDQPR
jgi:hypothetical protein